MSQNMLGPVYAEGPENEGLARHLGLVRRSCEARGQGGRGLLPISIKLLKYSNSGRAQREACA
jgi:hypothetical protein